MAQTRVDPVDRGHPLNCRSGSPLSRREFSGVCPGARGQRLRPRRLRARTVVSLSPLSSLPPSGTLLPPALPRMRAPVVTVPRLKMVVLAGAVGGQSFKSLVRELADTLRDHLSRAPQGTLRARRGTVGNAEVALSTPPSQHVALGGRTGPRFKSGRKPAPEQGLAKPSQDARRDVWVAHRPAPEG